MREINGIVVNVDGAFVQVRTSLGEIALECDDWRIADNGGLKVGNHVSALGAHTYPEPVNGRTVFYIGEDTSVWVNGVLLPIRPEGS